MYKSVPKASFFLSVCVCEFYIRVSKIVCEFDTIVLNCLDTNQRTIYCLFYCFLKNRQRKRYRAQCQS